MGDFYTPTDEDLVESHRRVHGNGEQTHVHVLTAGERAYVAVAVDVDPREYGPVTAELVAYDPTLEGARERTERWLEAHPKGVLGAEPGESGHERRGQAIIQGFWRFLKRVNEHGNKQVREMQEDDS